jgi:hypothetical protein
MQKQSRRVALTRHEPIKNLHLSTPPKLRRAIDPKIVKFFQFFLSWYALVIKGNKSNAARLPGNILRCLGAPPAKNFDNVPSC